MRFLKIKAGALQLVSFIVVIIALLLAAFVIFLHVHRSFQLQTNTTLDVVRQADEGITYALSNTITLNDTTELKFRQNYDNNSLRVHVDHWGIFEKIMAVSKTKLKGFEKIGLIGGLTPKMNRIALYLEDNNKPLVVVGNTKIEGTVYLPKLGVKTGHISGHAYYGQQLVYGSQQTSGAIPELSRNVLNTIRTISSGFKASAMDQFLDLGTKRVFRNSFYCPLQIIYNNATINLSEVTLTGHIIVQSASKIVVHPSSQLRDVLLIAPEIEIKDRVNGTFQAFATKGIRVGKYCKLNYPSALVLNEYDYFMASKTELETPAIKVHGGSIIKGAIVYLGHTKSYLSQVFIDKDASVTGEIYCNTNIELLGCVYGSVYTAGFVASQSGSRYQNHIYNGCIIADMLSENYVGILFNDDIKGVAKWLY